MTAPILPQPDQGQPPRSTFDPVAALAKVRSARFPVGQPASTKPIASDASTVAPFDPVKALAALRAPGGPGLAGDAAAIGEHAVNSALFGFEPKIIGAWQAANAALDADQNITPGDAYTQGVASTRDRLARESAGHGNAALTGDVGGVILSPANKLLGAGKAVAKGTPMLLEMLRAGGQGATAGAVRSLADVDNGDLSDYAGAVGRGAGTGFVAGAGTGVLAQMLGKGVAATRNLKPLYDKAYAGAPVTDEGTIANLATLGRKAGSSQVPQINPNATLPRFGNMKVSQMQDLVEQHGLPYEVEQMAPHDQAAWKQTVLGWPAQMTIRQVDKLKQDVNEYIAGLRSSGDTKTANEMERKLYQSIGDVTDQNPDYGRALELAQHKAGGANMVAAGANAKSGTGALMSMLKSIGDQKAVRGVARAASFLTPAAGQGAAAATNQ